MSTKKQQRQPLLPMDAPNQEPEGPSARELKRRKILDEAASKNFTSEITGFTGLKRMRDESFEAYQARQFQHACEVLNTEIDTLKLQQSDFLCGRRRPHTLVDRDYTLVMIMRAFADYLRFKPTE